MRAPRDLTYSVLDPINTRQEVEAVGHSVVIGRITVAGTRRSTRQLVEHGTGEGRTYERQHALFDKRSTGETRLTVIGISHLDSFDIGAIVDDTVGRHGGLGFEGWKAGEEASQSRETKRLGEHDQGWMRVVRMKDDK